MYKNSATSRHILVPFEWYKINPSFFPFVFVKTKETSLEILQKQKSFKQTQISIKYWILPDPQLPPTGGFRCCRNKNTLNSRKKYAQKHEDAALKEHLLFYFLILIYALITFFPRTLIRMLCLSLAWEILLGMFLQF